MLCDGRIPELSGVNFYRALRLRAPLAAERIVFVTEGVFGSETRQFLELTRRPAGFQVKDFPRFSRRPPWASVTFCYSEIAMLWVGE
jgi:hypothetical protein